MKKLIFTISTLALVLNFAFANPLEFKTLSSDFTQSVKSDGSEIKYSGNFIATNTHALWQYKSPSIKDIYFSFERVVIIEPELEQVILTNLKDVPNLTKVMQSAVKDSEDKYSAEFDGVLYHLEFKDTLIETIKYKDKLDNEVVIKFSNVQKDRSVDNQIFLPEIPANFDIITQ
ncbi:MAG: outer membrane lipoprotein chaperone LolA [Campylobacter sp.]|nr:outer membrane lipoprotein chaperone LolA [Campylobacter sp.]